jgi:hypothetical protein
VPRLKTRPPQQRLALETFAATGSLDATAKAAKVSPSILKRWTETEWWAPGVAALRAPPPPPPTPAASEAPKAGKTPTGIKNLGIDTLRKICKGEIVCSKCEGEVTADVMVRAATELAKQPPDPPPPVVITIPKTPLEALEATYLRIMDQIQNGNLASAPRATMEKDAAKTLEKIHALRKAQNKPEIETPELVAERARAMPDRMLWLYVEAWTQRHPAWIEAQRDAQPVERVN